MTRPKCETCNDTGYFTSAMDTQVRCKHGASMSTKDSERRPTREEQIGGRCKHFTGTVNERCSAGVRYDDVHLTHEPVAYDGRYTSSKSLPCVRCFNHIDAPCDKREFPTPEEVAATIERQDAGFRRIVAARAAIVKKIGPYKKGHTRGAAGTIPCPNCEGGQLHYTRAALNGHVWGRCSTEGCAAWME